jgi:hypothetical protein
MVKSRTAAKAVPLLTTRASVPGAPVVVVPTVTVADTDGKAGLMTTVAGTTGLTAMLADSQIVSVMAIR